MAVPPSPTAIGAATPNRLILDAGAMYKNWDTSPVLLGATRGGAQFEVQQETRQAEVDGLRGAIKGLRRRISFTARLTVTFIELSDALFTALLNATLTKPNAGLHTFRPNQAIATGDYAANMALVAAVSGSPSTPCVLEILNALPTGGWTITTKDKDEGTLGPVSFEAHYDAVTATTVPFRIHWPTGAS